MVHTVARQRPADRLRDHEKIERGLAGGGGEPARSKGKVMPLTGAGTVYADAAPILDEERRRGCVRRIEGGDDADRHRTSNLPLGVKA